MKTTIAKRAARKTPTLAELIVTVSKLTRDEQLSAYIVADLINTRRVRLEGDFRGRRVLVS
jgi:hypothetical protein